MNNNLPPALRLFIAHFASAVAITLCFSASAFAKNNCDTHASTINPAVIAQADSGIGGTGNLAGGIGGTGQVASEGGIGGTGIIGIITGFASVCVNGIEVHYDNTTPVQVDGRSATIRDLAAGQLIAAQALGSGTELTARHIAVTHAAIGPISSIDHEKGEIRVLNQTVQITRLEDRDNLSALKTGDWAQISGHRLTGGAIVASRIDTIPPRPEAKINGYITHIDSQGFEVNGTRVNYETPPIAEISRGMEISVSGHWQGDRLHAQQILIEPTRQSIGNVQNIVIEGYIHALDDKSMSLGNRIVTLDSGTQITGASRSELRPDQRIQISGPVGSDQRITPERIEIKQEQSLYLQQRIDHDTIDNRQQDQNKSGKDEPALKSLDSGKDGKDRDDKDNDQKNSGSGELKKESGHSSDKQGNSDNNARLNDHNKPSGEEKKSDRSESSGHEKSGDSQVSDNSEKASDLLREGENQDRNDRDHGGHSDRDSGHRDTDQLRDNIRDIDVRENVSDRPEIPGRDFSHRDRDFDR